MSSVTAVLSPQATTAPAHRFTAPRIGPAALARVMGLFLLVLAAAGWVATGWLDGPAVDGALPVPLALALLAGFGGLPLCLSALLADTGAAWLAVSARPAGRLHGPVRAQAAGALLLALAVFARDPLLGRLLGTLGLAAIAWGWGHMVLALGRMLLVSRSSNRLQASAVVVAGALGALLIAAGAGALAIGRTDGAAECLHVAVWAASGIVVAGLALRLAPSRDGLTVALVAILGFEGFVRWAALPPMLQAGVEAVTGFGLLAGLLRWKLLRGPYTRRSAMLLAAAGWLGIALLLGALSHALHASGQPGLGDLPLLAYALGGLGNALLALLWLPEGRRGEPGRVTWTLFWMLQISVIGCMMTGVAGWPLAVAAVAPLTVAVTALWSQGVRRLDGPDRPATSAHRG